MDNKTVKSNGKKYEIIKTTEKNGDEKVILKEVKIKKQSSDSSEKK